MSAQGPAEPRFPGEDRSREYYRLLSLSVQSRDVEELLSEMYQLTGSPVCLADTEFGFLACYPRRRDSKTVKWWPLNSISRAYHLVCTWGGEYQNEPCSVTALGTAYRIYGIFRNDMPLGFAIFAPSPLEGTPEDDLCCVNALSIFLSRNQLIANRRPTLFEQVFSGYIGGLYLTRSQTEQALGEVGFSYSDSFLYGKIVPKEGSFSKQQLKNLKTELRTLMPATELLQYDHAVHLLIDTPEYNENTLSEVLTPVLRRNNALAGISTIFKDFDYFHSVREQPDKALEIGKVINPSYSVHPYQFYVLYNMIGLCAAAVDITQFIDPAVLYLRKYDQRNGTEYVPTLQAYFNSDRNVKKAARHLNVHRNTFLYRMEKIEALTNIDFANEYRTIHLKISCSICKWMDKTSSSDLKRTEWQNE